MPELFLPLLVLSTTCLVAAITLGLIIKLRLDMASNTTQQTHTQEQLNKLAEQILTQQTLLTHTKSLTSEHHNALVQTLQKQHQDTLTSQQHELRASMQDIRQQLQSTLGQQTQSINHHIMNLQQKVDQHLQNISGQVDKRLTDGFAKTQDIFTDVISKKSPTSPAMLSACKIF
jgi:DNA recombination protein RmuC